MTSHNPVLHTLDQREAFFAALHQRFPHPVSELQYTNPYTLLVAVVLSAQSTDKGVNKATAPLFEKVSTPQDMLAVGEAALLDYFKTIGLYKAKTRYVVGLSHMLLEKFGGEVPCHRDDLMQLPGVGRKTANVVLNVAFGEPTMPVDTHVFRVANRTGLAPGTKVEAVEAALERVVPTQWGKEAHHLLILLGRYVCKARRPLCDHCPVREFCAFDRQSTQGIS